MCSVRDLSHTVENRSIPRTRRILINSERTKPLSFICLLPIVCALMLLAFFISAEESTVYSCKMSEFTRVPKQEADGRQWGLSPEVCSVQLIG